MESYAIVFEVPPEEAPVIDDVFSHCLGCGNSITVSGFLVSICSAFQGLGHPVRFDALAFSGVTAAELVERLGASYYLGGGPDGEDA